MRSSSGPSPDPAARVLRSLPRFRRDAQFQIVLALSSRRGSDGESWYRLSLPGRPNGARGWVRADTVEIRPVHRRIVIHVAARVLEVRRLIDGMTLLRARVAVGRPGAETPLGRNFYVRSAIRTDRSVLRCVRSRDERLLEADRLARPRRRRHPRHQPARAPRSGGIARMHSRPKRQSRRGCRRSPPSGRRSTCADEPAD